MGHSHTREAVGFIARWTLLAFVGMTIAAVTWASARTTAAVAAAVRARLVAKDWVLRPAIGGRRGLPLFGHVSPAPGGGPMALALVCFPGRSVRLMRTMDERCPWRLTDPRQGRYPVVIRGLPYGPVAFQTREAIVSCIPRDRPVLLVDARLALQELQSRPDRWRSCLLRMQAAGEVVFFHPGPMDEFTDCRDRLRQLHAGQPVVYRDLPRPLQGLLAASRTLGRGKYRDRMAVVTADADLARRAAKLDFPTHLIGSADANAHAPGIRSHASLTQLKAHLAARPIAR